MKPRGLVLRGGRGPSEPKTLPHCPTDAAGVNVPPQLAPVRAAPCVRPLSWQACISGVGLFAGPRASVVCAVAGGGWWRDIGMFQQERVDSYTFLTVVRALGHPPIPDPRGS